MHPTLASALITFLYILLIAVVIRALLSWFPGASNSAFGRLVYQFTEPLLEPVRRVMPRTGMIDLSALAVIILIYVMMSVVRQVAAD